MISMSEQKGNLFGALAKAQAEIKSAKFDAVNPHFKSKYATLGSIHDACKDALAKAGISVSQHCSSADGRTVSVTTLLGEKSGEWMQSTLTLPLDKPTSQSMGSAITYGRRYSLAAMVGVVADEDDDMAVAETPKVEARPQQARAPVAQQAKPVPAAHNPNALFVFPAGKYKGRDISSLSHDELRGWYHYFADKTPPGETQKGWLGEAMAIARNILDKDKDDFAKEEPSTAPISSNEIKDSIDVIPF